MDAANAKSILELAAKSTLIKPRAQAVDDEALAADVILDAQRLFDGSLLREILGALDPDEIMEILEPIIRDIIQNPIIANIAVAVVRRIVERLGSQPQPA